MQLGHHADAPIRETFDHVEFPQRARTVQWSSHDVRDEIGERVVVDRACELVSKNVAVDVEVRVICPVRVVETERHLHQPRAQRWEQVDALEDEVADRLACQLSVWSSGRVIDPESHHVAVVAAVFDGQELRVERCQLSHVGHLFAVSVTTRAS